MAKLDGQRPKLLFLLKILSDCTDEEHGISMREIIEGLEHYGVPAERKSIYADLDCLKDLGYDISMQKKDRDAYYTLHKRDKEDLTISELKILVDAVQASRFVSEKKSRELIGKLSRLASRYQADQLRRQVYLANRVKSINESGFKNIDKLHEAINQDKVITFTYLKWTEKKKLVPRKSQPYRVSPLAVTWSDENYYLIAYDMEKKIKKNFRVDKMENITVTDEDREGTELFDKDSFGSYSSSHFGMFNGQEVHVKLLCANDLAGVIIDRFGKNVPIQKQDKEHFSCTVKIYDSQQFIGWVVGLGQGVKIIGPDSMVENMKEAIRKLQEAYL